MKTEVIDKLKASPTIALVKKHKELRERIKEIEEQAAEAAKPAAMLKEAIEGVLLGRMNDDGSDSISTPVGTVYRYTHRSATVTDQEAFWRYAVEHDAPELYQSRANVTEVTARIEASGEPIPGVNLRSFQTARIRKG